MANVTIGIHFPEGPSCPMTCRPPGVRRIPTHAISRPGYDLHPHRHRRLERGSKQPQYPPRQGCIPGAHLAEHQHPTLHTTLTTCPITTSIYIHQSPSLHPKPPPPIGMSHLYTSKTHYRNILPLNPLRPKPYSTTVRMNENRTSALAGLPAISSTGYARKLIGPDTGPGSTSRSRPRLSSNRLAG
jgi:hypothetical protein